MVAPRSSTKKTAKPATLAASTDSVYINEHLITTEAIEAAIQANPKAKSLRHWGGIIDVKAYKNEQPSE